MLHATPPIDSDLAAQLRELDKLRARLGTSSGAAGPWLGRLRRQFRATAAESSVSIEGYRVPEGEAAAIVAGEDRPEPDDESRMALACYARAMDHVGTMAGDPTFEWLHRVILDLHFDACYFQPDKDPGLYRTGPMLVTRTGRPAYVAPDGDSVRPLMDEAVRWMQSEDLDEHVVVRAAMAHLHVVSVHPFRDGNGRIARIVQSLVLAREGLLAPEFGSIEEYLGRNTDEYYGTLIEVQGEEHAPERDATPWVRLCVRAHLDQARARLEQTLESAERWGYLEGLAEARDWPDRLVIALEQSLAEGAERTRYADEADISNATASADLRRLVDAGLVVQHGKGRNTRYVASEELRERVNKATMVRRG